MRAFALTGFGLLLVAASPPPEIADLKPIALHPGVNRIPGFLPGGGTATIVEAWRGNGNAHSYHAWMVLGGPSEGSPVGLVGVDRATGPLNDIVTDNPFDGERVLGAVRFATGTIAGRRAALLVEATLDDSQSGIPADHATATVRWFRLDHQADATGRTTDAFVPIGTVQTTKRYCNADLALRDLARVPLTSKFGGFNRIDGCFDAK
ncbi:hypothetical protein [Sphingomonas bacterium]|uniref:hypothetical protein n=1 Tax=Sphingomonas bacterium TaxID=1895847 RepID=UPI0015767D5A|nr:hypothetical protein [Sphingomonas bacterium]